MKVFCWFGILPLILISTLLNAQYGQPVGTVASSMGYVSASVVNPWCVANNQAGIAFSRELQFAFSYENRFMVKESGISAIAASLPSRNGGFGVYMIHLGNRNFLSVSGGLSYARRLSDRFAAGISLDFLHTRIAGGYGSGFVPSCKAGILCRLTNRMALGIHVTNPVRSKLSFDSDERYPVTINAGFTYLVSDNSELSCELFKSSVSPPELHTGFSIKPDRRLTIRAGLATAPFRYTFGAGFLVGNLRIECAAGYWEGIGASSATGFSYAKRSCK